MSVICSNMPLILGFLLGFSMSFMLTDFFSLPANGDVNALRQPHKIIRHPGAKGARSVRVVRFGDRHIHKDDDTIAKPLSNRIRVLVWVTTTSRNLNKKAVHVLNTWGKRANKLLFMSSKWNTSFPAIGLNVSEGRRHWTAKTMQAFRYVFQHHYHNADWFMKADDETYVVMENLRYMLTTQSTHSPVYFHHTFKALGFARGGSSYILSKEALKRLAEDGSSQSLCRQDGGREDVEMTKCLMKLGVKVTPSTDRLGRFRFHFFGPELHLQRKFPKWYKVYHSKDTRTSMKNISDYAVSFHGINAREMYTLEYFIYHLRPYGCISRT